MVEPRLTLMSVAKPWMEALPEPVMFHSVLGLPVFGVLASDLVDHRRIAGGRRGRNGDGDDEHHAEAQGEEDRQQEGDLGTAAGQ